MVNCGYVGCFIGVAIWGLIGLVGNGASSIINGATLEMIVNTSALASIAYTSLAFSIEYSDLIVLSLFFVRGTNARGFGYLILVFGLASFILAFGGHAYQSVYRASYEQNFIGILATHAK